MPEPIAQTDLTPRDAASIDTSPHTATQVNPSTDSSRLGLVLFAIYTLFYGGFVLIGAIDPGLMGVEMLAGLNLAIVYGFALIIVALLLALIYGWASRHNHDVGNYDGETRGAETHGGENRDGETCGDGDVA